MSRSDGCWEWVASLYPNGYGHFRPAKRVNALAHRYSYQLAFGPVPDEVCVLHRCDNRRCVRPDHLFLGTRADNNWDCSRKGRKPRGEGHAGSKLSDEQTREIHRRRAAGETIYALAAEFGVSPSMISMIVNRKIRRHI